MSLSDVKHSETVAGALATAKNSTNALSKIIQVTEKTPL